MNALGALLIALSFAAAEGDPVHVNVAPDQPLPYVYVDDPLILEVLSDSDTTAKITLDVKPDFDAPPANIPLDPLELRAKGTLWRAIENVPAERGRYTVHAHVEAAGTTLESDTAFCRVDRPAEGRNLPICAVAADRNPQLLLAASGISAHCLRLPASVPEIEQRFDEAASAGFQVILLLDEPAPEAVDLLAKIVGDRVARWDISVSTPEKALALSKGLRKAGAKAPISLLVTTPSEAAAMLAGGVGRTINGLVHRTNWADASNWIQIRDAAERAGYEGMTLYAEIGASDAQQDADGRRLCRQLLLNLAHEMPQTEVEGALIFNGGLGTGYPYLSALAQRLNGVTYVGALDAGEGVTALGFRLGSQWMLALWSDEGSKDLSLRLDNAAGLAIYDGRNNPLPAPELKDGSVAIAAVPEPRFLIGDAGSILLQTAMNAVHLNAAAILQSESLRSGLPPEFLDLARKFSTLELGSYNRLDFLNLVKVFPRLEEIWHAGTLSRSAAVPALAAFQRVARALCCVEQERGEAFVEPLQKTLGNCGQFQSVYLTSSSGTAESRERPDWLLEDIERLMAEAEQVNDQGRAIEACAVATLAEWRARALEIAAKAQPLSLPEKQMKQPEPPPPPKVKEVKEKKAKPAKAETPKPPAKKNQSKKPGKRKK